MNSNSVPWFEKGEFRNSDLSYALSPEFVRLMRLLASEGLLGDVLQEVRRTAEKPAYRNETTLLLALAWRRLRQKFLRPRRLSKFFGSLASWD